MNLSFLVGIMPVKESGGLCPFLPGRGSARIMDTSFAHVALLARIDGERESVDGHHIGWFSGHQVEVGADPASARRHSARSPLSPLLRT
jgi:hypothetical protein